MILFVAMSFIVFSHIYMGSSRILTGRHKRLPVTCTGGMGFHDGTKGLFTYRLYQHHLAGEYARAVAIYLDSHIRAGR